MKAAKITAKIRDAVPVCIYCQGEEQGRFRNIELPDEIKALEIMDFHFDIDATGWISFHLHLEPGILPDELPEPRLQLTREQKRAAKAAETLLASLTAAKAAEAAKAVPAPGEDYTIATTEGTIIAEIHHADLTDEAPAEAEEPADEPAAIRFDVPGKKRGALARAIADYTGNEALYLNPPSYAYQIGTLGLERDGSLIGELPAGLLEALAEQGFIPAE